jgi:hypothetical protein
VLKTSGAIAFSGFSSSKALQGISKEKDPPYSELASSSFNFGFDDWWLSAWPAEGKLLEEQHDSSGVNIFLPWTVLAAIACEKEIDWRGPHPYHAQFASQPYFPPTGVPGFAGDRSWDEMFSNLLEDEEMCEVRGVLGKEKKGK